jgi:hypothetical protein
LYPIETVQQLGMGGAHAAPGDLDPIEIRINNPEL